MILVVMATPPIGINPPDSAPAEVPPDGGCAVGAEELRRAAVGIRKSGSGKAFGGAVLAQVGPQLERQRCGGDASSIAAPVRPAAIGGISGAAEPPLVAAHDLAVERRRVDHFGRSLCGRCDAGRGQ